jgi:hypothetical protein
MIDVMFPKRAPTPRELDTRPVPSDYRPKQVRAVGADSDDYYGDEPGSVLDMRGINFHKLEDELSYNRLNEIATLMRALTYGEMMELAHAIWKIRPEGAVDEHSLPMMLHLWSMSPSARDAADGNPAEGNPADLRAAE